jgi:polyhydroxyalkanoic acid synthase PhaR subunit
MTQNPFDPFAMWRDALSKWESSVNDLANKSMVSPEFSQFMNQAGSVTMRMQHAMGEMMQKYLTAMNMPTRADITALGERLQNIEQQLARLAEASDRSSPAALPQTQRFAAPPRTKRPPTALNGPAPAAIETRAVAAAAPAPAAKSPRRRAPKKKTKAS